MEIMEPKEGNSRLHTQEVRGSSPFAPTTFSKTTDVVPKWACNRVY